MLVIRRRHKSFAARYPASVTLRPSRARYGRLRHLDHDDDHDHDHDHDHELRATSYVLRATTSGEVSRFVLSVHTITSFDSRGDLFRRDEGAISHPIQVEQ